MDDLQLVLVGGALHAPRQLQHHARVQLHGNHLLGALQQLHRQVAGTWGQRWKQGGGGGGEGAGSDSGSGSGGGRAGIGGSQLLWRCVLVQIVRNCTEFCTFFQKQTNQA